MNVFLEPLDEDDPDIRMLDRLPDEVLKPPPRFELYAIVATRMMDLLCREPPSRERDLHLLALQDALIRNAFGPEPRVQ